MKALRVDHSQKEIIRALEMLGATVTVIHGIEAGIPDLLVGYRGENHLVECKTPKIGYLSPAQKNWHARWRGGKPWVIRTANEVVDLIHTLGQEKRR